MKMRREELLLRCGETTTRDFLRCSRSGYIFDARILRLAFLAFLGDSQATGGPYETWSLNQAWQTFTEVHPVIQVHGPCPRCCMPETRDAPTSRFTFITDPAPKEDVDPCPTCADQRGAMRMVMATEKLPRFV